jgi:hypothetical protein
MDNPPDNQFENLAAQALTGNYDQILFIIESILNDFECSLLTHVQTNHTLEIIFSIISHTNDQVLIDKSLVLLNQLFDKFHFSPRPFSSFINFLSRGIIGDSHFFLIIIEKICRYNPLSSIDFVRHNFISILRNYLNDGISLKIFNHFIKMSHQFEKSNIQDLCKVFISMKSCFYLSKIYENQRSSLEFILQTDFILFPHPWFLFNSILKIGPDVIQSSILRIISWNDFVSEFENADNKLAICLFDFFDLILTQYPQILSDQVILIFLEKIFLFGSKMKFRVHIHSISPLIQIAQMKDFLFLDKCFQFDIVRYLSMILETTEYEIISQILLFFCRLLTLRISNLMDIFISNEIQVIAEQNLENEDIGLICKEFLDKMIDFH